MSSVEPSKLETQQWQGMNPPPGGWRRKVDITDYAVAHGWQHWPTDHEFYTWAREQMGEDFIDPRSPDTGTTPDDDPHDIHEPAPARPAATATIEAADEKFPTLTDSGNGERLARRHRNRALYCEGSGWHVWTGRRWKHDPEAHRVRRLATDTARRIADEVGHPAGDKALYSWAARSLSKTAKDHMITEAAPLLLVPGDKLDQHPDLLNCRNGVVDLRTGKLRPHDPALHMTRISPANYDPSATCPRWERFIEEVIPDDAVRDFVQCAVGYSLTGATSEQCFFFLHGGGRNGKSVFVDVIRAMLGDYSTTLSEGFLLRGQEAHKKEEASVALVGVRMATASEAGEGRGFDEPHIKRLTGGDTVTGRMLRHHKFDFRPQAKIWIAANHKPTVRGTDLGIWRRFRMIPFEVQIPESQVDKGLGVKLRGELDGIMAWAVKGAVRWFAEGLQSPAAVDCAVDAYKGESDIVGRWLEEKCDLTDPNRTTPTDVLYSNFGVWARDAGERWIPNKLQFARRLGEHGVGVKHTRNGSLRTGVGLLPLQVSLPGGSQPFTGFPNDSGY